MKAVNIRWAPDEEEMFDTLFAMDDNEASNALGIPQDVYASLSVAERIYTARNIWGKDPAAVAMFCGLPVEVDLPKHFTVDDVNDGTVTDWLSDTYGMLVENYQVSPDDESCTFVMRLHKK